jgi:hypothetical protein
MGSNLEHPSRLISMVKNKRILDILSTMPYAEEFLKEVSSRTITKATCLCLCLQAYKLCFLHYCHKLTCFFKEFGGFLTTFNKNFTAHSLPREMLSTTSLFIQICTFNASLLASTLSYIHAFLAFINHKLTLPKTRSLRCFLKSIKRLKALKY